MIDLSNADIHAVYRPHGPYRLARATAGQNHRRRLCGTTTRWHKQRYVVRISDEGNKGKG